MATKLYLLSTAADAGPTGELSTDTDSFTSSPSGKNTPLKMSTTKGSAQTSVAAVYNSGSSPLYSMMRMFVGDPLAAQTLTGGAANYILAIAGSESSTNMNLYLRMFAYVWRSGTGNVKTVITPISNSSEFTTGETGRLITTTGASGDFSILAGDRPVLEWWWDIQNTKATNYTATGYFEGATDPTEGTATADAASYFQFPQTLVFGGLDLTKSLSDGATLTDATAKASVLAKADSSSLADAISKAAGLVKTDSASLTDALAKAIAITKTDIGSLTDAISKAIGLYSFADGITATDFIDAVIILMLGLNDGITATDAISGKAIGLGKLDGITPSDNFSKAVEFYRGLSDSISPADSATKFVLMALAETITATDEISTSGEMSWSFCGVPFLYTAANWVGAAFYFEVYMKATSGTVYSRVYDVTASAEVASSELSTAETSSTQLRSSAITLTDTHVYMLQTGTTGAGEIKGGQLIAI